MVQEGVVLGHIILKRGIELDRAKAEVIERLPPLSSIKGVRSFLGDLSFYRRFIKDFLKIAKPLTHLFIKDVPFEFNEECLSAFHMLKEAFIFAPIM